MLLGYWLTKQISDSSAQQMDSVRMSPGLFQEAAGGLGLYLSPGLFQEAAGGLGLYLSPGLFQEAAGGLGLLCMHTTLFLRDYIPIPSPLFPCRTLNTCVQ